MDVKRLLPSALLLSFIFYGCSTNQENIDSSERHPSVTNAEFRDVSQYTVIEFEQGDNSLTEESKSKLKSFVENARYGGKEIENIKVLSWADNEPKQGMSTDFDRSIAQERIESIEDYLKEDLKTEADYVSYNMVEKKSIHDVIKSENWKRPPFSKAESRTLPKRRDNREYAKLMDTKVSKSLVYVDYE